MQPVPQESKGPRELKREPDVKEWGSANTGEWGKKNKRRQSYQKDTLISLGEEEREFKKKLSQGKKKAWGRKGGKGRNDK